MLFCTSAAGDAQHPGDVRQPAGLSARPQRYRRWVAGLQAGQPRLQRQGAVRPAQSNNSKYAAAVIVHIVANLGQQCNMMLQHGVAI